jgi:hypothetical protein
VMCVTLGSDASVVRIRMGCMQGHGMAGTMAVNVLQHHAAAWCESRQRADCCKDVARRPRWIAHQRGTAHSCQPA